MLGVVEGRTRAFVMVDIPGLIEGAHSGVGLGHDFLRHMERTRVVVHVIDGSVVDPVGEYHKIRKEMELFNEDLARKPEIVALNKADIEGVLESATQVGGELGASAEGFRCISAATMTGLDELERDIVRLLDRDREEPGRPSRTVPVLRPATVDKPELVRRVGSRFEVTLPAAKRLAAMVREDSWEGRVQLYEQLRRLGVTEALQQAGIRPGQTFRVGKLEWEWE
jgi:GTP-binding protein